MDECHLFHLTCAQGNGFYSPTPSTGDTPFEAQLFMNRQMQLFMKLIIEERWIRRGREREWGKGLKRRQGKKAETKREMFFFFFYRIVNHEPVDQWRAGLLNLFCFHSSHFPSTFLSFSSAFSTSAMVTSFTVHSALYLPPPSQVSLLPWQQQTSEWII